MPGLFIAPHTNWFSSPYSVSFETTEQNDNLKKMAKMDQFQSFSFVFQTFRKDLSRSNSVKTKEFKDRAIIAIASENVIKLKGRKIWFYY